MSAEEGDKPSDLAVLARGGRTNIFGFVLRLAARLPFLFIAGRYYGEDALGRWALAVVMVEFCAQLATLGQKRALAQQLAREEQPPAHVIADGMLMSAGIGSVLAAFLMFVPAPMFPAGETSWVDRLMPLAIVPFALTEVALAALAYRYDIGSTVKARAVWEPWTLSIGAGVFFYFDATRDNGLIMAYLLGVGTATVAAFVPMLRQFGLPRGWNPQPSRIGRLMWQNIPVAGADAVEWGTRRLDLYILGLLAAPQVVGIYYFAQQVASVAGKLKTSFEPILGPVITRKVREKDWPAIARQVCQVGFWILAAQAGIALALAIPGGAIMALGGESFIMGTGAMAILLAAETVAAMAVVSEAALIYIARMKNLWLSLSTMTVQIVTTFGLVLLVRGSDYPPMWQAAAAAAALLITLAYSSFIKSFTLSRILGERVNNFRWALVYAAAPAVLVGWLVTRLPDWFQLSIGIAAILATYGFAIWKYGFGPEDRVLFKKKVETEEPEAGPTSA